MKLVILCNLTTGIDIPIEESEFSVNHNDKTLTVLSCSYPRMYRKIPYIFFEYKPLHGVLFLEYKEDSERKAEPVLNLLD